MSVFLLRRGASPELGLSLEVTGSGNETWCYLQVKYEQKKYTSPTAMTLQPGDNILCVVGNSYAVGACGIYLNGVKVVDYPQTGKTTELSLDIRKNTKIELQYSVVPGMGYEYGIIKITEE